MDEGAFWKPIIHEVAAVNDYKLPNSQIERNL